MDFNSNLNKICIDSTTLFEIFNWKINVLISKWIWSLFVITPIKTEFKMKYDFK